MARQPLDLPPLAASVDTHGLAQTRRRAQVNTHRLSSAFGSVKITTTAGRPRTGDRRAARSDLTRRASKQFADREMTAGRRAGRAPGWPVRGSRAVQIGLHPRPAAVRRRQHKSVSQQAPPPLPPASPDASAHRPPHKSSILAQCFKRITASLCVRVRVCARRSHARPSARRHSHHGGISHGDPRKPIALITLAHHRIEPHDDCGDVHD
jgi:hypothetical protein